MKIKIDTREKMPWSFDSYYDNIDDIVYEKLATGDYSLCGYEDKICIERKQTVSEIAQNITAKRFENELVRMKDVEHAFMLFEFGWEDIDNYPHSADVPLKVRNKIRVSANFLRSKLARYMIDIPHLKIIACDSQYGAEAMAFYIFKNFMHNETN